MTKQKQLTVDARISQVIYTHEQIVKRCQELALWIDQNYRTSSSLVLVGLLKGSIPFLAELIKHIHVDHVMDFMTVSSFAGGMSSTGQVKVVMDLHSDINGKDVLIIEEIIDSGQTLFKIVELLKTRQPKTLKIMTLLDKKTNRTAPVEADVFGFDAPNLFYAGFGLDVKEKLRNLPYIGVFDQSKFNSL